MVAHYISEMPHIHTALNQHDFTASGYIIRLDGDEPRIVFHRHIKFNKYMQFGGHVELDEDPWEAVAHEIREESGYELDQLQVLQPADRLAGLSGVTLMPQPICLISARIDNVEPTHFHDDIAWAFITSEPPRHPIKGHESNDVLLLTRLQLESLPKDEIYPNVREIALFVFDTILSKWQPISAA